MSGYIHPLKNSDLMEAVHALTHKNVVEKVKILEQTFLGSKTQQQVETYPRSEFTKQISKNREIQNGDTREYKDFLAEGRMGNIYRYQGC